MVSIPLWDLGNAKRGERGAGEQALRQLAKSLRGTPSPWELEEVAKLLERAADGGAKGAAKALYLAHAKRPKETAREMDIWQTVDSLMDAGCPTLAKAYADVAKDDRFKTTGIDRAARKLTAKRIEEIYLAWRKEDRKSREESWIDSDDELRFDPQWLQWEGWRRDGQRWVSEAEGAYRVGLSELRRRQAEYDRWIREQWQPGVQAIVEAQGTP